MTKPTTRLHAGDTVVRNMIPTVIDAIERVTIKGSNAWRRITAHELRTGQALIWTVHESQRWTVVS